MPYNEEINTRLKSLIIKWKDITHKKMFGGVCYLLNGNMLCGVYKEFLILRLGPNLDEKLYSNPHVRPFDITGKPMKGWIMVEKNGFLKDEELKKWLTLGKDFVRTLPAK